MWKTKVFATGLALATILLFASTASASTWTEVGDAGDLLGSAQAPIGIGPLTSISGTVGSSTDADLYWIIVNGGGTFSATTVGGASFDTQLFLFDAAGMGVYANDDSVGLLSTLPAGHALTPSAGGMYYLGISSFNFDPISVGGLIFPSSPFSGVFGPTGPGGGSPISGWTGTGFSTGAYTITLTGAAPIPEPATLFLLGSGLAGLGFMRRRKKA